MDMMRDLEIGPVMIIVVLVTIGLGTLGSPIVLSEGFEHGLGPWMEGSYLPLDPNTGREVEAGLQRTTERARSGDHSIVIAIDGTQDDGTVWISRWMEMDGPDELEISFHVYSMYESMNTIGCAVAFFGNDTPEAEEQFTVLGPASSQKGWTLFNLRSYVNPVDGRAHVALGITVAWETHMTFWIDDVAVTIH
jgi:hypothetical protein